MRKELEVSEKSSAGTAEMVCPVRGEGDGQGDAGVLLMAGGKERWVCVSHYVRKSQGAQAGGGSHFVQGHRGEERGLASWAPNLALVEPAATPGAKMCSSCHSLS